MTEKGRYRLEVLLGLFVLALGSYIPVDAYYYTSGPSGRLESIFFILICFGITLNTILNFIDHRWSSKYRYAPMLSALSGTIIAFSIFYIDQSTFEKVDWYINYEARKQIVSDLLDNKPFIKDNQPIQLNTFIPVSNGGNEIAVRKCESGITVIFWIDRGNYNHHSEFVYSNCPEDIASINHILKSNKNNNSYRQIEPNWYRLNNY